MATHQTPHHHPKKQGKKPDPEIKNQGEGDKESAERYNEDLQRSLKKSDYEYKAKQAARALDSQEGPELRRAEEKGKARAKEEDPAIAQDFKKPSH
jgi:hypothetical protein